MRSRAFPMLLAGEADLIRCTEPDLAEAPISLEAAEPSGPDGERKLPRVKIAGYNGGPMTVGYYGRVVVDLAALKVPSGPIPILRDHNPAKIVGHAVAENSGRRLSFQGEVSGAGEDAREFVDSSRNGFPWRASIGVRPEKSTEVEAGASVKVNGRTVSGPVLVIQGELKEVSVLPLAADASTSTKVAARAAEGAIMDPKFRAWLEARGKDPEKLAADEVAKLKAQYDAEIEAALPPKAPAPAPVQAVQAPSAQDLIATERSRVAGIEAACAIDCFGNVDLQKTVAGIRTAALASDDTADQVKAKLLDAVRSSLPKISAAAVHVHSADAEPRTLEAALCMTARVSEKTMLAEYGEKIVEAATRSWRGLRLREFIAACCAMDGITLPGTFGSGSAWVKAAFSSNSLPGILGNVANKSLLDAYRALPSTARILAHIGSVSDFKTHTRYRLGGNMQFEKVGAGGELAHGELSEQSFTQKADTYGKYFALTRTDIVNDDLGAFLEIPRIIGRGAALALEEAFWTLVLANASSFFGSGNANYASGAGSALGGTALTAAVALMENQTDPNGKPIVLMPKFLVCPPALRYVAERLFTSEKLVVTGLASTSAASLQEDANTHRSRYQPVVSPYMSNSAITGYSATAWYLVSDPDDVAFAEIAFLNGQDVPVVEAVEVPSDTAGGRGFRAYHDFGVALQDPRGAVMSAGA